MRRSGYASGFELCCSGFNRREHREEDRVPAELLTLGGVVDGEDEDAMPDEAIDDGVRRAPDDEFADILLGNRMAKLGV